MEHRSLIFAYVFLFELNSSLREEDLYGPARWSARLYEHDNPLHAHRKTLCIWIPIVPETTYNSRLTGDYPLSAPDESARETVPALPA